MDIRAKFQLDVRTANYIASQLYFGNSYLGRTTPVTDLKYLGFVSVVCRPSTGSGCTLREPQDDIGIASA